MKKLILSLLIVVGITGCKSSVSSVTTQEESVRGVSSIDTLCLNGVEYYFYALNHKGGLTVKIDSETLKPSLCKNS